MQEIFEFIKEFVSRPDRVLMDFINAYGSWIYVLLFLIIFAETGLIVASFIMPFLPGDALIFAVGMIAANNEQAHLHIEYIIPLLMVAAMLGDNVNYFVGSRFGSWLSTRKGRFRIKPEYLVKTHEFFNKHGDKAIIIARFMPVVRTIMPFMCGTSRYNYRKFMIYSFIGAVLWVGIVSLLGYTLGGFAFVQRNLEFFIFGIIILANMPMILRFFASRFKKKEKG